MKIKEVTEVFVTMKIHNLGNDVVSILKFYLSKLPEGAKDADTCIFYLRPKAGVPNDPAAP